MWPLSSRGGGEATILLSNHENYYNYINQIFGHKLGSKSNCFLAVKKVWYNILDLLPIPELIFIIYIITDNIYVELTSIFIL